MPAGVAGIGGSAGVVAAGVVAGFGADCVAAFWPGRWAGEPACMANETLEQANAAASESTNVE